MTQQFSNMQKDTHKVLPDVWVVKIGGQSLMDRGRAAVYPVLEELVAAKNSGTQFIIGVGGGYQSPPRLRQGHGARFADRDASKTWGCSSGSKRENAANVTRE